MSVNMIGILFFPAFSTLDAGLFLSVCPVFPVRFWVIVVVSFCHISYCYILVNLFTGFHYVLQVLCEVIVIFAL